MRSKAAILMRLLGVCLFILILVKIDLGQVAAVIRKADLGLLFFAFLLLLPQYGIKALRWRRILSIQRIAYSRLDSLLAYLSANFVAFITPGRLGEVVKAFYVKQDTGLGMAKTLPAVILDRAFDVYVLTWVAASGMMRWAIFSRLGPWGPLVLGAMVIAPLLFLNPSIRRSCLKWLKRKRTFARWDGKLDALSSELDLFRARDLLLPFIQTLAAYLILFWASHIIARSAGIQVGFVVISFFVSIANILSFIPISVAGLGTRDASLIYLFSTIGKGQEEALAFSLLFFFVFYIGGGLIGFVAYTIKPLDAGLFRRQRGKGD